MAGAGPEAAAARRQHIRVFRCPAYLMIVFGGDDGAIRSGGLPWAPVLSPGSPGLPRPALRRLAHDDRVYAVYLLQQPGVDGSRDRIGGKDLGKLVREVQRTASAMPIGTQRQQAIAIGRSLYTLVMVVSSRGLPAATLVRMRSTARAETCV
ncbi:Uncharacterized protein PBTT_10292 [Plasmodiophora brassicae]